MHSVGFFNFSRHLKVRGQVLKVEGVLSEQHLCFCFSRFVGLMHLLQRGGNSIQLGPVFLITNSEHSAISELDFLCFTVAFYY